MKTGINCHLLFIGALFSSTLVSTALTTGHYVRRRGENVDEVATKAAPRDLQAIPPTIVGDNGIPESAFPLQKCQGDCDSDSECAGSLICYQREVGHSIPGCGPTSETDSKDYCIDPADLAPPGSFRLKLYWEQGYTWQEETIERQWCMKCDGTKCDVNDKIRIRTCDDGNTRFMFHNVSGKKTQIKVATEDLCFELVAPRSIQLRRCDVSNKNQFFQSSKGNFSGDKFEIQSVVSKECLTQEHHPKDGESIGTWDCKIPRGDQTNFWNRF